MVQEFTTKETSKEQKRVEQSLINETSITSDSNTIEIYVDSRELPELKEKLQSYGITVNVKQLDIGDIIISNKTVIERKTTNDFESSIIDGRLFEQAAQLSENYEIAIIIVEGPMKASRIRQNAFIGAYLSLITNFGIHVINTKGINETAHYIYLLAKREQIQKKRPVRLLAKRKTSNLNEMRLRIIESFPSIGPTTAKKLAENFNSLERIFNSDIKELERIIGKAKASKMHLLIHKEFDK